MTTIEGNKLIADFMEKTYQFEEDLKYHTLWDWIMPVADKINNVCKETGYVDECVELWNLRIVHTPLNTVWESVIHFIKWYNDNKN